MAEQYPQYYTYEEKPVFFAKTPDGGLGVWALSARTGEFELSMRHLRQIRYGTTADIVTLSREEFIQQVERFRARKLTGDGPVYAVYETMNSIEDTAWAEPRNLTPEEKALVHTLRLRSHELFEAELRAQGRQGMPEDA